MPVIGELTDIKNTIFVKNNAPSVSNIELKGADDGNYYTGDVRLDYRTILKYTVEDIDNYENLKVTIYEDNGNNVFDSSENCVCLKC